MNKNLIAVTVIVILAIILILPGLTLGVMKLGYTSQIPYPPTECPTTKAEAEALFGNDANLWSLSERGGWVIGPLDEKVIVTRPPLFIAVLTYDSGRQYIPGVSMNEIHIGLNPGQRLELICPL